MKTIARRGPGPLVSSLNDSAVTSMGAAAGGSSDSLSMALTTVTATSTSSATNSSDHPRSGSTGETQGGATSIISSDVPAGSRTTADQAPRSRWSAPPSTHPMIDDGASATVPAAPAWPVGTNSTIAGRSGRPARRARTR